jgi:hypothetical protein
MNDWLVAGVRLSTVRPSWGVGVEPGGCWWGVLVLAHCWALRNQAGPIRGTWPALELGGVWCGVVCFPDGADTERCRRWASFGSGARECVGVVGGFVV